MGLEESFDQLCRQVFPDGLKAGLITDKDGVVILKSTSPDAPINVAESTIPSTFAIANNQASKLGLKDNRFIVSMFDLYQVVQLDSNPLNVTLVGDAAANTGLFINLGHQIVDIAQPLVKALQERQQ
ncbi:mitogen-activated protein kinase [Zychaea mexicana]|uniref:mitogen-activated protein kinase n=1 Tax=Zychaea mexicana TaxID=64656 RepID=UPI0022FE35F1|nr:mitogen-activated protein kinase [Zychaea mexicana]KAI9498056.1 mitogen-activated protein kinase [Zychaea mexicana]